VGLKGFSLVELMITIAIVGVLAAVAIPAYSNYMVRSRIAGMITSVDVLKKSISEYRVANGNLNQVDPTDTAATLTAIGTTDPVGLSVAIGSIKFAKLDDDHMAIAVCGSTSGQGTTSVDTVDIYLTASYFTSGMKWGCAYSGNSKYVPKSCRNIYDPGVYGALSSACAH